MPARDSELCSRGLADDECTLPRGTLNVRPHSKMFALTCVSGQSLPEHKITDLRLNFLQRILCALCFFFVLDS